MHVARCCQIGLLARRVEKKKNVERLWSVAFPRSLYHDWAALRSAKQKPVMSCSIFDRAHSAREVYRIFIYILHPERERELRICMRLQSIKIRQLIFRGISRTTAV